MAKNKIQNQPKSSNKNKLKRNSKSNAIIKDKERWKLLFQSAKNSASSNLVKPKKSKTNNSNQGIRISTVKNKKRVQSRRPKPVMNWIEEDITDEDTENGHQSISNESEDLIESFIDRSMPNQKSDGEDWQQLIVDSSVAYNEDSDSDWEDIEDEDEQMSEEESDAPNTDDLSEDDVNENELIPYASNNSEDEYDSEDFEEEESLSDEYFENGYFLSSDEDDDDTSDDEFEESFEDYDFSDEDDDEDYRPPSSDDDLYIKRGDAKIYDIDDNNISFPDYEGAQLVEITEICTDSSSSCPELVPIDNYVKASATTVTKSSQNENVKVKKQIKETSLLEQIFSMSRMEHETTEDENNEDKPPSPKPYIKVNRNSKTAESKKSKENQQSKSANSLSQSKCYTSPVLSDQILLHLKEKIFFNGYFNATLIAGKAESCGYKYVPNHKTQMFSPKSQSLLYITPISSSNENSFSNFGTIEDAYLLRDLQEIKDNFNASTDAVLILERNNSLRAKCVQTNLRKQIFPDFIKHNIQRINYKAECILKTFFHSSGEKIRKFQIQDEWRDISLTNKSRTIVMGGKGVGKSHLIRYLVNKSLETYSKVGLIDFDIGQSEIFLPQTLSAAVLTEPLLGHGAFYPIQIKKSIVFGDISVTLEQIKYIHCLREIIKFCQNDDEFKAIPWIINTMGYTKGLGEEIIVALIKDVGATNVIQIQSQRTNDNFSQIITSKYVENYSFNILTDELADLHETSNFSTTVIQSYDSGNIWNEKNSFNQKDMRLIIILAHLGQILKEHCEKTFLDISPRV